jgi:hypothetical protein
MKVSLPAESGVAVQTPERMTMGTFRKLGISLALALGALTVSSSASAQNQPAVSATDLSQLETTAIDIRARVSTLRTSDPTLATEIDRSLKDLEEEVTYLRVKMRREGSVTREEYTSVRDRLETLRVRARGPAPAPSASTGGNPGIAVVPVGAQLDVRLQAPLNSGTATVEQRFEATTIVDYTQGTRVVIPAGSLVRGFVSSVRPAGRIDRRGSLTLSFDELRIGNRTYRLRAAVTEALDGKMSEDISRVGAASVVGAIVGGIIGGTRGALIGILVGGGGTIAATEGSDVDLPTGTILRIRVDQPIEIAIGQ